MAPSLQQFIEKSLVDIMNSLGDRFYIENSIDFEVSVTTSITAEGRVNIMIANVGGKGDHEITQKMKFSIGSKDSLDFKKSNAVAAMIDKNPTIALTLERGAVTARSNSK